MTNEELETEDWAKAKCAETKDGALMVAGLELDSYIAWKGIAEDYFKRTSNWMYQRMHHNKVNGKPIYFKEEEYTLFASALRDIASKLINAADAIDNARMETEEEQI